ncbi:arylesterase [Geomonas sp.]|uniref:arylesterase n=1 Tax=Geomonas sp. TaxID=2651584 RepID=UPI002B467FCA|nr:arylesterase [Geomonas sp.]HJV33503.1 arylesterase [Geomonas sp.]
MIRQTLVVLFIMLSTTLISCCHKEQPAAPAASPPSSPAAAQPSDYGNYEGTLVAVGDSLTAGLGVPESEAYPAQLERKLQEAGYHWRVINAGISGETTSGTLSRLNWILKLKPDVVILEIGANDGFRAVSPEIARRNIEGLVSRMQDSGAVVVLAGMRMLRNLGPSYTSAFAKIYPSVAREKNILLIPFFLDKVAGQANLNLPDGIHPNAEGYRIVTDTVFPYAVKAIESKRPKKSP